MTSPAAIADKASENGTDRRDGQGLPQDHGDDAVGPRTQRHPNRDFPRSHRDAIGGHSVKADAGEQERHDAQHCRRPRQHAVALEFVSARIFWSRVASSRRGTRGSICATSSRIAGARGPA